MSNTESSGPGPPSTSKELDLGVLLDQLAAVRPLFYSEADFQHALARQLQLLASDLTVRLERRPNPTVRQAADIWVTDPGGNSVVLELKYFVRAVDVTVADERFVLAHQGAHDTSRYDTIKDLTRIEGWVRAGFAVRGAVIAVTNDPTYWRAPTRITIDGAFRLHENRTLTGEFAWADAAAEGTTRGRVAPLQVEGAYTVAWRSYSTLPDGTELRALVLDTADSGRLPPPSRGSHSPSSGSPRLAPSGPPLPDSVRASSADKRHETVRQQILDVACDLTDRGLTPFSPQAILDELHRRSSRYADSTIRTHIVSAMCINAPANHAVRYPDLRRVDRGRYVLADSQARR